MNVGQSLSKAKEEVTAVDSCPDCFAMAAVHHPLVFLWLEDVVAQEHLQLSSMAIEATLVHLLVAFSTAVVHELHLSSLLGVIEIGLVHPTDLNAVIQGPLPLVGSTMTQELGEIVAMGHLDAAVRLCAED